MYMHIHKHIVYVESLGQKFHPALELLGSHGSVRFSEKKNQNKNNQLVKKTPKECQNSKELGKLKIKSCYHVSSLKGSLPPSVCACILSPMVSNQHDCLVSDGLACAASNPAVPCKFCYLPGNWIDGFLPCLCKQLL